VCESRIRAPFSRFIPKQNIKLILYYFQYILIAMNIAKGN